MKSLTRLRDWWQKPQSDAMAELCSKLDSVGGKLNELNQQVDFLKYVVSAFIPLDKWQEIASRPSRENANLADRRNEIP